ncbi:MAG: cell division protein FtsL [Ignavibacteriales bacterium]
MIQTGEKFASYLDFDEGSSCLPVGSHRTPVSKPKIFTRLALFILILCIGFTFLHIQKSLMGYKIVELKKDIATLETDNKKLELQVAELSSLDRVQKVAEKRIGMYRPDENCMIAMAGEIQVVPVVNTVSKPTPEKQPMITMKSLYQGIASIFDDNRTVSMKD